MIKISVDDQYHVPQNRSRHTYVYSRSYPYNKWIMFEIQLMEFSILKLVDWYFGYGFSIRK